MDSKQDKKEERVHLKEIITSYESKKIKNAEAKNKKINFMKSNIKKII